MAHQLKKLFDGNLDLQPLLARAQMLKAVQQLIVSALPSTFASSTHVLDIHAGKLVIAAANVSIAAKIRQITPEIITLLQGRGYEVSGIQVKAQVSSDRPMRQPGTRKLSPAAQHALHDLSLKLADSPLKSALKNLSRKNTG